jgi:FtsP/CotA-like multicopper oxidase with cupredoxin domain
MSPETVDNRNLDKVEPELRNGKMKTLVKYAGSAALLAMFMLALNPAQAAVLVQCPGDDDGDAVIDNVDSDHPNAKCMHLSAGDGFANMADGRLQYMFGFGDLTGTPPDDAVDVGILHAQIAAPTIELNQGEEFYLSLTNTGMVMRPDLFDSHTLHFHGFPNASSVFDGLPDASVSVNMGATLSYYYNIVEPGTYMYHCHVEAAEHMQMGMLGNLFVRPRQNRCDTLADDVTIPGTVCPGDHALGYTYAYNDGDGSTRYDVEVPIQIGSFDPDFHDASLNVQPLPFAGMRDRYFLLNGRGYPDTVNPGALSTMDPLGNPQVSQPVSSLIEARAGQRILLRISNLSVTNFYTLGTSGLPMDVVGLDARLLRDGAGNNMNYKTNSLTLGGGQSADVIITAPATAGTYFLYTKNLHQLANDAENFGGMMTEICVGTGTLCP